MLEHNKRTQVAMLLRELGVPEGNQKPILQIVGQLEQNVLQLSRENWNLTREIRDAITDTRENKKKVQELREVVQKLLAEVKR